MNEPRPRFDAAWHLRYGDASSRPEAPASAAAAAILEHLMAHRSVRAYLDTPVGDDELSRIVAAAQSAATSSNLQAWTVVAVRDPARKARLADFAGGQAHIKEAPLLLVWIADLSRLDRTAARLALPSSANEYFEMFLVAAIDAALAAQNAVLAAEALGLGTCYIGAMRNRPEDVAAELNLPPHAFAVFGMTVGRPDPARPASVKPRLAQPVIVHHETYGAAGEVEAVSRYDEVMNGFQASQSMKPVAWSQQSSQRVAGPQSLSGRDRLVAALSALGFDLR